MILTSFRIVSSFQKGLPTARLSNAWRMSHTMTHSAIGSLNTHRNPFYPSKNAYSNAHSKFMSSKKLRMSAVDTLASTQAGSKVAYDLNAVRAILNNGDSFNNVPESVVDKVGSNLHLQMNHPLNIIKKRFVLITNQTDCSHHYCLKILLYTAISLSLYFFYDLKCLTYLAKVPEASVIDIVLVEGG